MFTGGVPSGRTLVLSGLLVVGGILPGLAGMIGVAESTDVQGENRMAGCVTISPVAHSLGSDGWISIGAYQAPMRVRTIGPVDSAPNPLTLAIEPVADGSEDGVRIEPVPVPTVDVNPPPETAAALQDDKDPDAAPNAVESATQSPNPGTNGQVPTDAATAETLAAVVDEGNV